MTAPPFQRLLLVDDDDSFRERLARAMESRGLVVRTASDSESALQIAVEFEPEAAVLDLRMPGATGMECLRRLKALFPHIRVLMLTGYGSISSAMEAVRTGAWDYLTKPADAEQILSSLVRDPAALDGSANIETASLDRVEWEHIQRVLNDCGGNISKTAEALGMHRRSLQRKLNKYPPVH